MSWQNKLCAGFLLGLVCTASFAVELNKPAAIKPQMQVSPKATKINSPLVAVTKQNARKQGRLSIGKTAWRCRQNKCTSNNGSSAAVTVRNCKGLARKVGAIRSFRGAGRSLSAMQLRQCNAGLTTIKPPTGKLAPQVSKPQLAPGLNKPQSAKPIQQTPKPAPLRPPKLMSKPELPGKPRTITRDSRPVSGGSTTTRRAPISIPYTTTTSRLEIIGNPNFPTDTDEPFTPITLTTRGMEIIGNPTLPEPESDSFDPVTITTPPMEVIGAAIP